MWAHAEHLQEGMRERGLQAEWRMVRGAGREVAAEQSPGLRGKLHGVWRLQGEAGR